MRAALGKRMVRPAELPEESLLHSYAIRPECYTDCYATSVKQTVSFPEYVSAFYTTPLFRLERFILRIGLRRPSSDTDVENLALGMSESFAVWQVENRSANQILLREFTGATRSWLMVQPDAGTGSTRLYFGSAVVPKPGKAHPGPVFRMLLGFHKLYSRSLLAAARRRLSSFS